MENILLQFLILISIINQVRPGGALWIYGHSSEKEFVI